MYKYVTDCLISVDKDEKEFLGSIYKFVFFLRYLKPNQMDALLAWGQRCTKNSAEKNASISTMLLILEIQKSSKSVWK